MSADADLRDWLGRIIEQTGPDAPLRNEGTDDWTNALAKVALAAMDSRRVGYSRVKMISDALDALAETIKEK